MVCFKLVKKFQNIFKFFLLQGRNLVIMKYSFYFTLHAKKISFEAISVLKIRTFAAKFIIPKEKE